MRKPNFNENVADENFVRRGFRVGLTKVPDKSIPNLPAQKIGGLGNFEIYRRGMETQASGKRIVDFDNLRTNFGMRAKEFNLSEATLSKLFDVDVPDINDITWINEYKRLETAMLASGASMVAIKEFLSKNPPFGRPQRTVKVKRNLGATSMTTENKLNEILQELSDGKVASLTNKADVLAAIAVVLNSTTALTTMTTIEYAKLTQIIRAIASKLGTFDRNSFGIPFRIIDIEFLNANIGAVSMYCLIMASGSSNPAVAGMNEIIYNYVRFKTEVLAGNLTNFKANPVKFESARALMAKDRTASGQPNLVMDLDAYDAGTLIDETDMLIELKNGTYGDLDISMTAGRGLSKFPGYDAYLKRMTPTPPPPPPPTPPAKGGPIVKGAFGKTGTKAPVPVPIPVPVPVPVPAPTGKKKKSSLTLPPAPVPIPAPPTPPPTAPTKAPGGLVSGFAKFITRAP